MVPTIGSDRQYSFQSSAHSLESAGLTNESAGVTKNGLVTEPDDWLKKEQKVLLLNTAAAVSITIYGSINWDYFQSTVKTRSEGWFGRTTKNGGADKLGHLWSTYAASHLLASIYEKWGYSDSAANSLGALSSLGLQTLMEIGDGYSEGYGISYEDQLMNIAGAGAAFVLGRYPFLKSKIDLRVEYKPSSVTDDPFSSYDHQRYLLALKLDGFDTFKDEYLGYLELHAGYFTRGYQDFRSNGPDNRERSIYFGIGLNVTKLVQKIFDTDIAVFNYLQIPYTSVRADVGLD